MLYLLSVEELLIALPSKAAGLLCDWLQSVILACWGLEGLPLGNGVCTLPALTGSTKAANFTLHLLCMGLLEAMFSRR